RHRALARRDLYAPNLPHRNARQRHAAVCRRLVHPDLSAGVGVDTDHEVLAVLREVCEGDVPAGPFHGVSPPGRYLVAREPGELAPLVGRVVEVFPVRAERLRAELYIALVRAHMPHLDGLHVPPVHTSLIGGPSAWQRA